MLVPDILFHFIVSLLSGQDLGGIYNLHYGALACDDHAVFLECPVGYHIAISDAFYGRRDVTECVNSIPVNSSKSIDSYCNVTGIVERLQQACDNQSSCYVDVIEGDLDPQNLCIDVFKYLQVSFHCICKLMALRIDLLVILKSIWVQKWDVLNVYDKIWICSVVEGS